MSKDSEYEQNKEASVLKHSKQEWDLSKKILAQRGRGMLSSVYHKRLLDEKFSDIRGQLGVWLSILQVGDINVSFVPEGEVRALVRGFPIIEYAPSGLRGYMKVVGKDAFNNPKFLGHLFYSNLRGYHIFGRPNAKRYLILDDIHSTKYADLISSGFQFCIAIETSPNNYQVVIDLGQDVCITDHHLKELRNQLHEICDSDKSNQITSPFGRIPGFYNVKKIHYNEKEKSYPLCRIRHHENTVCHKTLEILKGVK